MSSLTRLASAHNFRDVAGPAEGYRTTDGRQMRAGILYRSNELQLSDEDVETLAASGLAQIFDLRSPSALATHPDRQVPGAAWQHLGVQGLASQGLQRVASVEDTLTVMVGTYTDFVHSASSRASFGELLRAVANEDGVALLHCTAGKDRTGWASALLQTIAGVDHETVVADYLLSNERRADPPETYLRRIIPELDDTAMAIYEPALRVRAAYLEAGFDAAREDYGDLQGYLRDGLDVDVDAVGRLRARLTQKRPD